MQKAHIGGNLTRSGRRVAFLAILLLCLTGSLGVWGNEQALAGPASRDIRKAQQKKDIIVAVGDSLTAGLRVEAQMAYPAQLERKLRARGYDCTVVNAGVSGETSSGTLSRIQWVVSRLKPDIVILETGANDGLRGIDPQVLEDNLDQLVKFLRGKGIVVVLAGMQMLPNLGPEYTAAFARVYSETARRYSLIFMPFFLESVAGDPRLNQADGIHPTGAGYTRIVDNLLPYIVRAIRKQSETSP